MLDASICAWLRYTEPSLFAGLSRRARARAPNIRKRTNERWFVFVWRRGRDSNPRWNLRPTIDLANRPLQPLGYLSVLAVTGGRGGIRTHEAFACRFSRPVPSTARSPFLGRAERTDESISS